MADYGDAKPAREITPDTRSVPDATVELADTAIAAFIAELADYDVTVLQSTRSADLDTPSTAERRGGRFAWRLDLPESRTTVLMPGAPLATIKGSSAHAPCLQVDGEDVWWKGALYDVAATARSARSSSDPLPQGAAAVRAPAASAE